MAHVKKDSSSELSMDSMLEDLNHFDISHSHGEFRRTYFVKHFKLLSGEQKKQLCLESAKILRRKFNDNERLEATLYLLATAIAQERDWDASTLLLDSVVHEATSSDFLKELALILLEVSDHELEEHGSKIPLGQTLLVLLTELGLQLAAQSGHHSLSTEETGRVVEYITTNLLARSNVNNNAMRISLVHYLSRFPMTSQTSLQLNRVISRFGQSLLDDMLKAFFEDKRRGNAAFFFLVEHLNCFFTSSPALADMSHNVLKHFMLKHPDEFPAFIASYCEFIPKEQKTLEQATKHLSMLLRCSVEVGQRPLVEAIGKVLLRHLNVYGDVSYEFLQFHLNEVVQNVTLNGRLSNSPYLDNFLRQTKMVLASANPSSVTHKGVTQLTSRRKPKEAVVKMAKVGDKPSPLEQMLQLAS